MEGRMSKIEAEMKFSAGIRKESERMREMEKELEVQLAGKYGTRTGDTSWRRSPP